MDPVIMCHGALGNKNNFGTVGRALHEKTGRTVYSMDMVNHGSARRNEDCSYQDMANEINDTIAELAQGGHQYKSKTLFITLTLFKLTSND